MRSVAFLLALASSAFAFTVSEPNNSTGWTTSGPNEVAWTTVSTDPANFTIVLNNQNIFPQTTQVLAALVDASLGKITVNPPSGGWKSGPGFRVNLVKDAQDLNSILAQSDMFTISTSTSSTFSTATGTGTVSAGTGSGTLTVPPSGTTGSTGTSGNTGNTGTDTTGALNPTGSDTSTTPNGASASMGMQAGLFAGVALLGAFLA
ncbi:hypothetical protein C8Q70DRAFT_956578 [Cubamyces menziesii]|uniref:Yeast cell wall synthesis Kre9/Knh1-like N-terminal domain-containing protein n=1 Tax=Trametes cubensis TaxID=1111947 RepID=A0AAD7U2I9_9APHY|nr:hypothetical protein C8Q70DRAFT_956578 [Cubamyces menziesii]KAJ8494456.1 hypothetical protein ONZ51_g2332 [Trametes cubensis]